MEQGTINPPNGWKAYYAATKAIMNLNAEFYSIIREGSLPAMSRFWLNADYVKCIHATGEFFTGYALLTSLRSIRICNLSSDFCSLFRNICPWPQPYVSTVSVRMVIAMF